jgi:putative colanic acid biosysnthesis UDP-glucose lipid carrier transferase
MSTSAAEAANPSPQVSVLDALPPQRCAKRWSRQVASDVVGFADVCAITIGSLLPGIIYSQVGGLVTNWVLLTQSSLTAAIVVHMVLRLNGMYETVKMHDFPSSPGKLFLATLLGMVAVLGLGVPHAIRDGHSWIWFLVAMSASYMLILVNRSVAKPLLAHLTAAGKFDQRIAVFGAGNIARRVHDHLSRPDVGIYFAGVYDDRAGEDRLNPEGLTVTGRLDDLLKTAREDKIDQIVIALPSAADRRIADVAKKLEQLPVSVHIVTHISSDLVDEGPAHKVSSIGPVGLLDVKKKPLADWSPLVKRLEDIVVGSFLLLVTLPLWPLIALAIKLESRGPVIFSQRRRGLNLRTINMYKFRTMTVTEDGNTIEQAKPGDQRVTCIGRILRRTSMDELPQLINVLKGEMSLVGPRPHALAHDEHYGELVDSYVNRHQMKPGMTGLAQVRGFRGQTATTDKMEARINSDIDYIRNWSFGLDMKILVQTIWAVVTGKNAH